MRRAVVLIVILLAALALVACGKDDDDDAQPDGNVVSTAPSGTTPVRSERDDCRVVAAPEPRRARRYRRPKKRLSRSRTHVAIVRTNCGTIRIRLAVRKYPKTASSFASLARRGFYDGLTFHRIAKPGGNDYVIQGGDPLGTGNGGPGYTVRETPRPDTRYRRYDVAMAKTEAQRVGTSGSQFFIVTAREAQLDPDYAVLGHVVDGRNVVQRIAALTTDPATEMPLDPVVIRSVRIESSPRRR